MLLMGDELLRTQQGNNNAYCQNNAISWMNWRTSPRSEEMHRYVKALIQYRKYLFSRSCHEGMMVSLAEVLHRSEICWHGVQAYLPDWGTHSHALAMSAISLDVKVAIYVIFNAYWAPLTFNLPLPPQDIDGNWRRILDTALPSPHDIIPLGEPLPEIKGSYEVAPRSACLLVCGGFHQRAK